jgi:hypothetical protein
MTAVASSESPIVTDELRNTILGLPEKDFWDLVGLRVNPPSQCRIEEIIDAKGHIEYLTEAHLIDDLFIQLATTKQIISHNGKNITIYKYYHQAFVLRKWIPIARPSPPFIINLCDLSAKIFSELKTLDECQIVLKQAVGRVFENIDARQYHISIAKFLEVELK